MLGVVSFFLAYNPTAFQWGPFSIQWYALFIVSGIILAEWMIRKEGERYGIDSDTLFDLFFWTVIFGFIGARIYYVIFSLDYYLLHPEQIIAIWNGGMAIYGGVIVGAVVLWILAKKKNIFPLSLFDIVAPAILIAQSIGRWGNFMNQEAHGGPVPRSFLTRLHLPNWIIEQMNIDGVYYHPTFLYESVWSFIGVMIMLILRRQPKFLKRGELTAFYFIWYGFGRLFIEGLRTDSLYLGHFRVSQVLSLILILVGLLFIILNRKGNLSFPYYTEDYFQPVTFEEEEI